MAVESVVLAARAMDGLNMRMAALAFNLANANSPGFRSLKVDFEASLRTAAQRGSEAVTEVEFAFQRDRAFAPDEDRREDLLLVDSAQTAQRFAALADMVGRRLAMVSATMGAR